MVRSLSERIADARGHITFVESARSIEIAELWERGGSLGHWAAAQETQTVAAVLSNSEAAVIFLLGTIRCGLRLISVPLPPRGASTEWYEQFVVGICRDAGARHIVVDASLLPLIPSLEGIRVHAYEAAVAPRASHADVGPDFEVVQFTSGSTHDPRGLVLTANDILANVDAILTRLAPVVGDQACSWLPLSHDMGLIGMLLGSLLGMGPEYAGSGVLHLIQPQTFLRDPSLWLDTCSANHVTITAAPEFGLALAARRSGAKELDLASIRACLLGGEPVRAETIRSFSRRFGPLGFGEHSFCPAYGLAEAALAVTMTEPGQGWTAVTVDADSLSEGRVEEASAGLELVSAGKVLPRYDVSVNGEVGGLRVRGPSISGRYLKGEPGLDGDGWLATGDLAFIKADELIPIGRHDDVLLVAGRKIYVIDIEAALSEVNDLRPGRAVVLPDRERFVIAAELATDSLSTPVTALTNKIRALVVGRVGVAPSRVLLIRRGTLPMTASGKIRRHATAAMLSTHQLSVIDDQIVS
jgi:acyl-CoA synthetase (AMP-forming)/AMP-acid ligase II